MPEIRTRLEEALDIAGQGNYELSKIIIVACKHALQSHALEFAQKRLKNAQVPSLPEADTEQET